MAGDLDKRIQERAYEIWESEGRPQGRSHEHWEQARAEFTDARSEAGAGSAAARKKSLGKKASPAAKTKPASARGAKGATKQPASSAGASKTAKPAAKPRRKSPES